MEKYSIRSGFSRFKTDLKLCKSIIENFLTLQERNFNRELEMLLDVHQRFVFMADMCKAQGLTTVGKVNPYIALSACGNLTATVKTEYLEDPDSENIQVLMQKVLRTIDNVVKNVEEKMLKLALEALENPPEVEPEEKIDEPETTPNGSFKEFPAAAKKLLENFKTDEADAPPQNPEDAFYNKLNAQLSAETAQLTLDLEDLKLNDFKLIQGSVSIHQFFRPDSIKQYDYSVVNFDGLSYSRQKREVIAPIHVFHNQLLIAIKVSAQRFHFRHTPLTPEETRERKDASFEKLRRIAEADIYYAKGPLINFTTRFTHQFLVSKAFPGVRFLWFIDANFEALMHQVKDGSVALMWGNNG